MTVTNTGSVSESYIFSDPQCDANYPLSLHDALPICVGQSVVYTCSHRITSSDTTSGYTNTACATSGQLQSCDHVHVDVPGITVLKEESIGGAALTHNEMTRTHVGTPVNQTTVMKSCSGYEPYSFSDPQCDANTLSPARTSATPGVWPFSLHDALPIFTSSDTTSGYTNTACATSGQQQSCDHVHVDVPGMTVLKLAAVRCSDLAGG